ncbi:hypothetical protein EX895_003188 [Sporisorium graminicola]|uniref:Major facilitator superfamily (MFS) profile domain-containing protein n=1 Tax=Sporisorium graminicola TaxID=280036 RepID=A0A4U7KYW4_9BASI|nr:hypothetical protein EX895_003188 [Sporisorium graminicola]TKY88092.1 hypothetical protein EX895_003188 [Sporisorium graminicola]
MDSFTSSEEVSRPGGPDSYINYAEMAEEQPPSGDHDGVLEAGLAQANKEQAQGDNAEPYCAFTTRSKLFIVLTVSMASFFSPFSINIYIPALPQISNLLHTSEAATNVTVTVYMIAQGLSPVLWAPLSDVFGRRPIYIMTFLIFVVANLGLSFTNAYWLLVVLRMVQAAGACSAIAIGAGTIGDVTERKERGGYMGYYALAQYTGPAIGPVIGGALSQRWDYHATFFFLSALSGLFLIFMIVFLVETLRVLVGNGRASTSGIYRPLVQPKLVASAAIAPRPKMNSPLQGPLDFGFHRPFLVFARPETSLAILAFSMVYASYYLSSSSLPYLFKMTYGLDELLIGVCFVPSGVGCAVGTVLAGKILDWDYRRALNKNKLTVKVTRARLQSAWIYLPCYAASLLAYGWCVQVHTHIAAPIVFQFTLGMFSTMYFTNVNTLIVDLYPGKAASATAAVNVGRCLLGAVAVAAVQPMIAAMGAGWTFTTGALLTFFIGLACQVLIYLYGEVWATRQRT